MSKRKKPSKLFRTARVMGRNVGRLALESMEGSKVLAKKGSKGLKVTAATLGNAGRKAGKKVRTTVQTTAQETIPQLMKEFKRGLKEGMKKK